MRGTVVYAVNPPVVCSLQFRAWLNNIRNKILETFVFKAARDLLFTSTYVFGACVAPVSGAEVVHTAALSRPAQADPRPTAEVLANVNLPPLTGPTDLPPLDASVLPPLDERWESPEEKARHHRIMDELWSTKLGQLYLAYLTQPLPPSTIPGRANQIITMIFADGDKAGARVRVVQLLTQDLVVREKLDLEGVRRTIIFDHIVQARKTLGEEETNRWIVNGMITTAAIAAPFGFDGVYEEAGKLYQLTHSWVYCRENCSKINSDMRRLLNPKNLGRYHPVRMFDKVFLKYFGPISMFYFLWYAWKPGWMNKHKSDTEMLDGRDDLLEHADF